MRRKESEENILIFSLTEIYKNAFFFPSHLLCGVFAKGEGKKKKSINN